MSTLNKKAASLLSRGAGVSIRSISNEAPSRGVVNLDDLIANQHLNGVVPRLLAIKEAAQSDVSHKDVLEEVDYVIAGCGENDYKPDQKARKKASGGTWGEKIEREKAVAEAAKNIS